MNRLSPTTLRVLLAVLNIHRRRPVTIRGICQALGFSSPNAVGKPLNRLEAAGLIAREPHQGGTIRPTCTVELFALTPRR